MAARRRKRSRKRRRRFASPADMRLNLEGIAVAQERYRREKLRQQDAEDEVAKPTIIESIEKSKRAWLNALRQVRKPEDLNDFE